MWFDLFPLLSSKGTGLHLGKSGITSYLTCDYPNEEHLLSGLCLHRGDSSFFNALLEEVLLSDKKEYTFGRKFRLFISISSQM